MIIFFKKAEKLFESIEGEAAANTVSDYNSISILYNDDKFIGSKFIPNPLDPEKILEKLNLLGFQHCLELFGWYMSFKFKPFFVEAAWVPYTGHA